MHRRSLIALLLLVDLCMALAGCSSQPPARTLTIAVGTTLQDTGFLDALLPRFREETGIEVKVIAVGTGQALELARRGDADALWVHEPTLELKFMEDGYGSVRRPLMHNSFILVGPPDDPAGVKGEKSISTAFAQIAKKQAAFYSRGDKSGTHEKELALWKEAHAEPKGDWYRASGVGMAALLRLADQKGGYALTDWGTYQTLRKELQLELMSQNDPPVLNQYNVILVNPDKYPHVHYAEAERFMAFLTLPETKQFIADFGKERFGEPIFFVDEPKP
jgi:tungstate transport system substrate-binding protein